MSKKNLTEVLFGVLTIAGGIMLANWGNALMKGNASA